MATSKKTKKICETILRKIDSELPIHGYANKAAEKLKKKGVERSLHQIRNTRQGKTYDLQIAYALLEVVEDTRPEIRELIDELIDYLDEEDDDKECLHPALFGLSK